MCGDRRGARRNVPRRRRRVLGERHLAATLLEGFLEDVDLPGRFDVVMFSFYSYSYIPGSQRRIAALRKAADHLNPAGHVLVSHAPLVPPHALLIALGRWAGNISRSDSAARTRRFSLRRTAAAFEATGRPSHSGNWSEKGRHSGPFELWTGLIYPNRVAALTVAPVRHHTSFTGSVGKVPLSRVWRRPRSSGPRRWRSGLDACPMNVEAPRSGKPVVRHQPLLHRRWHAETPRAGFARLPDHDGAVVLRRGQPIDFFLDDRDRRIRRPSMFDAGCPRLRPAPYARDRRR